MLFLQWKIYTKNETEIIKDNLTKMDIYLKW